VSARGPLPPALAPLAHAAALGYGLAVRAHVAWWSGRRGADVGVPVVSVGNVSAGGTGKTPFVRWAVEALRDAGRSPMIAMRGYRAHAGRSDEAEEYRAMLPGVPCAVGADRVRAIASVRAAHPAIDCAVLDDGFQHRRVARSLDIVLVDATLPAIGGPLLPAGWLREPASALARADLVVVTRAAGIDPSLAELVRRFRGRDPDAWTRHAWDRIERHGPAGAAAADAALRGRRAWVACAIGNPGAFVADVRAAGADRPCVATTMPSPPPRWSALRSTHAMRATRTSWSPGRTGRRSGRSSRRARDVRARRGGGSRAHRSRSTRARTASGPRWSRHAAAAALPDAGLWIRWGQPVHPAPAQLFCGAALVPGLDLTPTGSVHILIPHGRPPPKGGSGVQRSRRPRACPPSRRRNSSSASRTRPG
jgi:tetraacyldisaccharide 4'-kinase